MLITHKRAHRCISVQVTAGNVSAFTGLLQSSQKALGPKPVTVAALVWFAILIVVNMNMPSCFNETPDKWQKFHRLGLPTWPHIHRV